MLFVKHNFIPLTTRTPGLVDNISISTNIVQEIAQPIQFSDIFQNFSKKFKIPIDKSYQSKYNSQVSG